MAGKRSHKKKQLLRIEFHVRVKHSPKLTLEPKFLREAVNQWVESGLEPSGVRIEAVTWSRNATSTTAKRGTEDLENARQNMLKRLIHAASWTVTEQVGRG